jgi:hypothetical protein
MRSALAGLVGVALVLSACSKSGGIQSKAAIQAAIERHLQGRPNVALNSMTVDVQDVRFDGDRAEAEVKFRSKQAPDLTVDVHYVLRRVGDRWEVESSSVRRGMGGSPHGAAGGRRPGDPLPAPATPTLQPSH